MPEMANNEPKKEFVPKAVQELREGGKQKGGVNTVITNPPEQLRPTEPPPKIIELHNKTKDKVAIVGFTETQNLAPYQDKTWEIWACNEFYARCPRLDVLFEIHSREEWGKDCGSTYGPKHTEWLQKAQIPIYMAKKYEDIPTAIAYPWEEIKTKFPHGDYLNNSISIMIALALFLGYKEIGVWGVEMAHHTEFPIQRPSCEYWLGIISGLFLARGYPKLTLIEGSELLNTPYTYGLENIAKFKRIIEQQEILYQQQMNRFLAETKKNEAIYNQYYGGLEALKQIKLTRIQG